MSNVKIDKENLKLPEIDIRDAAALVVASVALEEIALSHILNAEGEKIQAFLPASFYANSSGYTPAMQPSYEDLNKLLQVNESVRRTIETIICKECVLLSKLGRAFDFLDEHCMEGYESSPVAPVPYP